MFVTVSRFYYGFVIYGFRSKLVCLSKPVKATDNRKDTILLQNLSVNYESVYFIVQAPDLIFAVEAGSQPQPCLKYYARVKETDSDQHSSLLIDKSFVT